MRLDWKSGQAFLDRAIFTMSHTLDFHSGKPSISLFQAVKNETRPDQFQLARAL